MNKINNTMVAIPILLIDDDTSLHHLLNAVIKTNSIPAKLYTAGSEREGVECYKQLLKKDSEPAIVLMDLKMQGTDGVDATRKIKAINTNANIFILTGYEDAPEIEDAMAAGAKGVIKKVANYTTLLAIITYTVAHTLGLKV
jgi:DNA-binding NarL/FixJ family response regulator